MAVARLKVNKSGNDRYKLVFESEKGKITCDVPAEKQGKTQSEEDRRQAALTRARQLSRAFHESIPDR